MFMDGVMEGSSTLGTGDYTLTGAVYNGKAFSEFADEDVVCYIVQTIARTKYEIILGSYDAGPPRKLRRTTVLQSSAGGSKIDWQEDDNYIIASFASATVLAGFTTQNLDGSRPWWVRFGRWLRSSFPSAGFVTEYFYDGTNNIKLGTIDQTKHTYESVSCPAGIIQIWPTATAPSGFLLCRGQSLLRASYPALFTAIGTDYGSADSDHFNIPNLIGRYIVGVDASSSVITGFDATEEGNTGGAQTSTAPVAGGTLAGTVTGVTGTNSPVAASAGSGGGTGIPILGDHHHPITAQPVSLSGSTGAFSILPPSMAMNYVISTGGV